MDLNDYNKINLEFFINYYYFQERIIVDLKNLRDKMVFAFIMLNALFVLVVFILQLNQDIIHLQWPLGQQTQISYDTDQEMVRYFLYTILVSSLVHG